MKKLISNPFRPGAGHMPPYLAGRESEKEEFRKLLQQSTILDNLVLTGLRGVGKTVLLETFKPIAQQENWLWVGTDLSESASISEENIAIRIITDISVLTSGIIIDEQIKNIPGFASPVARVIQTLDFNTLIEIFSSTPGLVLDKLKSVLVFVWRCLQSTGKKGLIFAYDEAQNLSDQDVKQQFPLSLLLDVFQSIQRQNIPFMLVLTGLPTLFPKLVDSRTFAERMFHIIFLDRLKKESCREAILKPIEKTDCPKFNEESVEAIINLSGGYPYFIQFICREALDVIIQKMDSDEKPTVPVNSIMRKMDTDFFSGRWAKATDRQRELMLAIANLENCDREFTVQEIVDISMQKLERPFGSSHVNQMLTSLINAGLIYKNRYGKYSFAVPLLGNFIKRQVNESNDKKNTSDFN